MASAIACGIASATASSMANAVLSRYLLAAFFWVGWEDRTEGRTHTDINIDKKILALDLI